MHACDLLRGERDEIVAEWARVARRELPADAGAAASTLTASLPELLGELANCLEHPGEQYGLDGSAARRHALSRLRQGLDIVHVLHEYRILRDVMLRRLLAAGSDLDDGGDVARASAALDLALAEAVGGFCDVREQTLRAETERLRLVLEAAAIGMWEWLPPSRALTWDTRTRALFGLPAGAVVTYERFLSMVHPDDRERVDALVQEKLRSGSSGDEYRVEYRAVGADGVERWLSAMGRVSERDANGNCVRFIGATLDVSESKRPQQVEAQLALLRERFVGIVSHDLRNPLGAIQIAAGAIERTEGLTEPVRRNVARILKSVDRMARIIGDLLDLTRSRLGGGIPIETTRANMKDIAEAVAENVVLARPGRRVVTRAEGDLDGEWDPDRIAQALGNLVTNALDHGDPQAPVQLHVRGEDGWVLVGVHNDGEPIPSERLPHIFDPFVRAQSGASGGLGLGLFIVHEIVGAHGGAVSVTSDRAAGTTFQVRLPRKRRAG